MSIAVGFLSGLIVGWLSLGSLLVLGFAAQEQERREKEKKS